jgi:hypothetical protein
MSERDVLLVLLADPNLLASEREALQALLTPSVANMRLDGVGSPQGTLDATATPIEGGHEV